MCVFVQIYSHIHTQLPLCIRPFLWYVAIMKYLTHTRHVANMNSNPYWKVSLFHKQGNWGSEMGAISTQNVSSRAGIWIHTSLTAKAGAPSPKCLLFCILVVKYFRCNLQQNTRVQLLKQIPVYLGFGGNEMFYLIFHKTEIKLLQHWT